MLFVLVLKERRKQEPFLFTFCFSFEGILQGRNFGLSIGEIVEMHTLG